MGEVYQSGSVRRVKRAKGRDVWEWRYRVRGVMRQQTFSMDDYPTEAKLWKHLQLSIAMLNEDADRPLPLAATMGAVIQRYKKEVLPDLARSTQGTDRSMIDRHIEPMWADTLLADLKPAAVDKWIKGLTGAGGEPLSGASKGRARRLMKQLFDKAKFWEYVPLSATNPMSLIRVKGSSKRQKKIVLLSPEQVWRLYEALSHPSDVMVLIAACLGLRIEEIGALRWTDFAFEAKIVRVQRAWTHGELKPVKTSYSEADMPMPTLLADALIEYREWSRRTVKKQSQWLFPADSKSDEKPRWTGILLQDHIRPVATKLGFGEIGWHSLRHNFRSFLGEGDATLIQMKDLMRHASIGMMADVYGGTGRTEALRPHVDAVADKFRAVRMAKARQGEGA